MGSAGFDHLSREALSLPPTERSQLATLLLESLPANEDAPWHEAWDGEIRRRIEEVEQGRASLVEHDEAMSRARALLARARG